MFDGYLVDVSDGIVAVLPVAAQPPVTEIATSAVNIIATVVATIDVIMALRVE